MQMSKILFVILFGVFLTLFQNKIVFGIRAHKSLNRMSFSPHFKNLKRAPQKIVEEVCIIVYLKQTYNEIKIPFPHILAQMWDRRNELSSVCVNVTLHNISFLTILTDAQVNRWQINFSWPVVNNCKLIITKNR